LNSILITGGAGFIGANFVRHWRRTHPYDRVIVLDALTYAGRRENLAGLTDIIFVHGDIRDYSLVRRLLDDHHVGTIVHFAAESHVDRSIAGPDIVLDTNVNGTHTLLKAAKAAWLDGDGRQHRFHHISTDEVYGSLGPSDPAFREDTPYAPNSPYSASKAASDHLVRAYHHTYGLQTTISNCSNNYGPYQFPEKLIPLMILNALAGKALPIYGDGMNIRDWLEVSDHCRAISMILEKGVPGETYNVGGKCERTNREVVDIICSSLDEAFKAVPDLAVRFPHAPAARGRPTADLISFVTDRLGHDRRYAIDISKIGRELGFHPAVEFTSGLSRVLNWYLDNQSWWHAVHGREASGR
jgi:dTDP-glucose 4,6-dehydratase